MRAGLGHGPAVALAALLAIAGPGQGLAAPSATPAATPLAAAAPPGTIVRAVPAPFADPVWDDGQAEFSTYRGTIDQDGHERPLSARMIAVKEEFDLAQGVKSDPGAAAGRTTTAIKLNVIREFASGTVSYHQMASVFFERASLAPLKLTMASSDGCGISYVEVIPGADQWRHSSRSYWQGEAARELAIDAPGSGPPIILWDGLPLWLRSLDLRTPQRFEIRLLPGQMSARVQATRFIPAGIQVFGREESKGLRVRLSYRNAQGRRSGDTLWFRAEPPHVLRRIERGDGLVLDLVRTQRLAYWTKTAPGDEALVGP